MKLSNVLFVTAIVGITCSRVQAQNKAETDQGTPVPAATIYEAAHPELISPTTPASSQTQAKNSNTKMKAEPANMDNMTPEQMVALKKEMATRPVPPAKGVTFKKSLPPPANKTVAIPASQTNEPLKRHPDYKEPVKNGKK